VIDSTVDFIFNVAVAVFIFIIFIEISSKLLTKYKEEKNKIDFKKKP